MSNIESIKAEARARREACEAAKAKADAMASRRVVNLAEIAWRRQSMESAFRRAAYENNPFRVLDGLHRSLRADRLAAEKAAHERAPARKNWKRRTTRPIDRAGAVESARQRKGPFQASCPAAAAS